MQASYSATRGARRLARDIVVIGGSAGSLDAMVDLAAGLPGDYHGSLFIVSHIGPNPSQLPALLAQAGRLPAQHARHEEHVKPGRIYIAPPDRHLLLTDRMLLLSALPREHFTRPAIDPLFRSAARTYGRRVIAIVLSGTGSDGALGLVDIRKAGGVVIVQNPAEAAFPQMPKTARYTVEPDHVSASADIAGLLVRLIDQPVVEEPVVEEPVLADPPAAAAMDLEPPFALTCPECGGAVHEVSGAGLVTYRCHIGHRFGADELLVHQLSDVERAVMVAVRVLRERVALCNRMIGDATEKGRSFGASHWQRIKQESEEQLKVLGQFMHAHPPPPDLKTAETE